MPEYSFIELDNEDDWIVLERIARKYKLCQIGNKNDIKVLICDIDGTMTDGSYFLDGELKSGKRLNTIDFCGIEILRNQRGISTIFLSNDIYGFGNSFLKLMKKLNIVIYQNKDRKYCTIENIICNTLHIKLKNIAYIGDDINDKESLEKVGMSACPKNAVKEVKEIPGIIVLNNYGGHGAVREFIDNYLL